MPVPTRRPSTMLLPRALERRILLDAAALSTGIDALADATESEPPPPADTGAPGAVELLAALDAAGTSDAAANAAPVISGLDGDVVTFTEGDAERRLDAGVQLTLTDTDSANFAGGVVRLSFTSGFVTGDNLTFATDSDFCATPFPCVFFSPGGQGTEVVVNGVHIGDRGGVLTLNADSTVELVQTLLREAVYRNQNGDNPTPGIRTVAVTVSDGDGGTSLAATVTINVVAVNDAPTITAIQDQSIAFGESTAAIPFAVSDPETDATRLTVTVVGQALDASNFVVSGTGANRTVQIVPPADFTGTLPVTVTVSDGELSTTQRFNLTVAAPDVIAPVTLTPDGSIDVRPRVDVASLASNTGSSLSGNVDSTPSTSFRPLPSDFGALGDASARSPDSTLDNLIFSAGESVVFDVPESAFLILGGNPIVALEAALADGAPLPTWLTFDPVSGTFQGLPPSGETATYELAVTVRDDLGNEAVVTFTLSVEGQQAAAPATAPAEGGQQGDTGPVPPAGAPPQAQRDTPAFPAPGKTALTAELAVAGEFGRQTQAARLLHALALSTAA